LALSCTIQPQTIAGIAKQFSRVNEIDVAEILETLVALGRARPGDEPGTFVR
jgi:hypothetical protein